MASSSKDTTNDGSKVSSDILNNLISELETLEDKSIHPVEDNPETKIDKLTGTKAMLKLKEFVDSDDQEFEDKLELLQDCKNVLIDKIENEKKSFENPTEKDGVQNDMCSSSDEADQGKKKVNRNFFYI